jgi:hypothetical protein
MDEDVEKITIRTMYGSYEFLVMPSRLCNVSLMFMTFMNSIFYEKLDKFMIIYCQGYEDPQEQRLKEKSKSNSQTRNKTILCDLKLRT